MKLSVIIPAYNEERTIRKIIGLVQSTDIPGIEKEIIVVDDGSTDQTRAILQSMMGIRYIFHERNLGKGGAIKTGFEKATGDIYIIQDADLEYDPGDYHAVIRPILNGKTNVVLGVRIFSKRDERRKKSLYWLSWLGNHLITLTTNILYLNDAGEYEACYKAFTKKALSDVRVETNNFDYDNELVCKLLRLGYKTMNVPIRYYPRSYSEGKKINWKHGFLILWTIIKWRFLPF